MYEFGAEEIEAAVRVLDSRQMFRYLPNAHEADALEANLAHRMGARHVVAVSSGTAALICGLAALGIGPGDEVIVPAYGFVAGVLAPLAVGAVPVVCDIDESLTLDPGDVIGKITPRTRAIMPVHVHGWAADLGAVCDIAASRGLYVVEDACQAIGGSYRGRHLGTVGDVGAFSFNQHKIVTAGEGGALLTSRTDLYERAFVSHDGSSTFSRHRFGRPDYAGLAFRLNEVSAAILNVQVGRLDDILARLRSVRDRIQAALASAADLRPVLSHDPVGACGTNLGYLFDSPEQADTFLSAVDDDEIVAFYGIGYGHSYPEWDLLHQRRGGHHPLRNPLLDSDRQQTAEGCSRSQDILRRCVIVEYPLDVDDGAVEALHARVAKAFGLFLRKDNDGGRPHS